MLRSDVAEEEEETHGSQSIVALYAKPCMKARFAHTASAGSRVTCGQRTFTENIVIRRARELRRHGVNVYETICSFSRLRPWPPESWFELIENTTGAFMMKWHINEHIKADERHPKELVVATVEVEDAHQLPIWHIDFAASQIPYTWFEINLGLLIASHIHRSERGLCTLSSQILS